MYVCISWKVKMGKHSHIAATNKKPRKQTELLSRRISNFEADVDKKQRLRS